MLITLVCLLAAATIAVPLARRAGVGGVLGYLLAGVAIGPGGLRLVTDVDQIASVASLGVVMLLFLIGLELRPARLWVMRQAVLGLGLGQIALTAAVLAALARAAGVPWTTGGIVGLGLALSSTAIVLPLLAERDLLAGRAGRDAFAVLLCQDLAFIPLVALVPLFAAGATPTGVPWRPVAIGLAAIGAILIGGRILLPRAFRLIGGARTPEVFTALALLTVTGTAALAQAAGLSASLGAFLAGVLLSESEYRHELRADIEPFEGILLGAFFMSVGMAADLGLLLREPGLVAAGLGVVLLVKLAVAAGLGAATRQPAADMVRFAAALSQGSEFSFVLFAAAVAAGALAPERARVATLVVALSMAATPLLFAAAEAVLIPRLRRRTPPPVYDAIAGDAPVIIAGFGRVGQVVGRLLRTQGIAFTALERDPGQVEVIRRFGNKVFYGDPSRPDLLRAAGAESARLLIVAVEPLDESLAIVEVARRVFPHLTVLARARNRRHVHLLLDRDVDGAVRDTFHSALRIGGDALTHLGRAPDQVARAIQLFTEHDERVLRDQHAIYRDERQLIQTTREAAEELQSLFEADQPAAPVTAP
jgi:monovalent cation:proton antiporter-2 (CPA2) family protein